MAEMKKESYHFTANDTRLQAIILNYENGNLLV